ncbi:hypothetical protein thsps21_44510 [Pseudomonas sp. No.21]|uniref:hypothetical protein n=1 Tax=Pseudomonas TaxID=286 RepID=UPI000DA82F9F|nr:MULTISPECIES: hypothetical protein [Pseudomonas]MDW3711842.1 hypothetical protein [Pseudomonas sp. 2023EL-01195]PZE14002.1 hypothetical protein DMX10_08305 [Pseudomonas sp. 57B-090624]GJN47100.1 hypothetical protein TUM20249_30860 [Pseudomonas tohonis]
MKPASRLMSFALGSVLMLALGGCDLAEESANKLADKAQQAAENVAREAISEAVEQVNKQVDDAQKSAKDWLGKPQPEQEQEQPPQQADKREPGEDEQMMPPVQGVET